MSIVIIVVITLTACGTKQDDTIVDVNQLQDFKNIITQSESPIEVKEYLDKVIPDSGMKTADALVIEYINYMDNVIFGEFETYEEQLQSLNTYFNYDTWTMDVNAIKKGDIQEFYTSYTDAGFKFINVEGGLSLITNYHFLEKYSQYISPDISDFGSFMSLDSDNPWAMDAGIIIPLTDLGDRIALAEIYVKTYPDSVMYDKVLLKFNYYLSAFLRGLDNTPLVLFDTKKVDATFIEAYEYYIAKYPDLITTATIKAFKIDLEKTGYSAPYSYNDEEKRSAFMNHIDKLVTDTINKL